MTRQSSATSLASAASTIQNENPSNITITPQASPTQNGPTSSHSGSSHFPIPKSRDTLKRSNGENPYEIIQDETKSIITLPDEMAKFSTPTPPPTSVESIPKIPDKLPVSGSQNNGFERSYKGWLNQLGSIWSGFHPNFQNSGINSDPQEALLESVESLNGLPPPPLPPKASGSIGDISSSKSGTSSSKSLDQSDRSRHIDRMSPITDSPRFQPARKPPLDSSSSVGDQSRPNSSTGELSQSGSSAGDYSIPDRSISTYSIENQANIFVNEQRANEHVGHMTHENGVTTSDELKSDLETGQILDQMIRTAEVRSETKSENPVPLQQYDRSSPEIDENELHKLIISEFPPPTHSTPTQKPMIPPKPIIQQTDQSGPSVLRKKNLNKSEFTKSENRKSYIENLEAGDEPVEENEFQKYSKESFKALLNKFDQKNTSNNFMVSGPQRTQ